jgi:hypothetical protein
MVRSAGFGDRASALGIFGGLLKSNPAPLSVRRKNSFARLFFFQDNRFSRADFRRQQNFIVRVSLGVDDFGDHLSIESEDLRRGLDALGVAVAFGSIDGDFHSFSPGLFKKLKTFNRLDHRTWRSGFFFNTKRAAKPPGLGRFRMRAR